MAQGYFDLSTSNPYVKGRVNWWSTPNNNGNYSDVYVEMQFWRTNTGYTTYGNGTFGIYVDGQPVEKTTSFTITNTQNPIVVSGTVRINHSADGTKSITIGGDGNTNVFDVYANSTTAYLDNIPRASTISSNVSWTAGTSGLPVTLTRASNSFLHFVEVQIKSNSTGKWEVIAQRTNVGDSTTIQFSESETKLLFQHLNKANDVEAWVKADTYNGGTFVGTYGKYGRVYNAPGGYVTFSSFAIGDPVPAQIRNYYSQFTYDVKFTFGGFTRTFLDVSSSPTFNWTQEDINAMYAQIPTTNSGGGTATVFTYYKGIQIRNTIDSGYGAVVTNSNPDYTGGFTYADTDATTKGITGNDQYIIQGKSKLQVKIPVTSKAKPKNSATMSRYEVTINGTTKSVNFSDTADLTVDFGIVDASSNASITVSAVDSRGNKTSASSVILMLPYSPPNLSVSADRLNNFEEQTTIKLNGTLSPLNIGGVNKNQITSAKFQRREVGGTYDTPGTPFTVSGTPPNFTATDVIVNLNNTFAWEILVTVTDKLGTTVTTTRTVSVGTPIFFIDTVKKTLGVNKFPTSAANGLEIAGNLDVDGIIKVKGDQFITSPSGAGIQLKNSDIAGLNSIYFNDQSTGGEGVNFLKTGKPVGSTVIADYDTFAILDGNIKINDKSIFAVVPNTNNFRLIGDMYSYEQGGVIFDTWGNIKGQPTAVSYNTWSIADADGRPRLIIPIGKGSTAATEYKAYIGGHVFYHEGRKIASMWQTGDNTMTYLKIGYDGSGGILRWDYYNNQLQGRTGDDSDFTTMKAYWATPSAREYKKDIVTFDENALELIRNTLPRLFHFISQDESEELNLGLIVDESPKFIVGKDGTSIDPYAMCTLLWKAVQELLERLEKLEK